MLVFLAQLVSANGETAIKAVKDVAYILPVAIIIGRWLVNKRR